MLKLPTMARSSPQATSPRYRLPARRPHLLCFHGNARMNQDGTTAFTDAAATWNRRFEGDELLFGAEPNEWLREQVAVWPPGGRILCVADGEGRNSVWLARQGFVVDAFDIAEVGVAKARQFAARQGVTVNYSVADCATYPWPKASVDGVAAIFIQFADPAQRARLFAHMKDSLKAWRHSRSAGLHAQAARVPHRRPAVCVAPLHARTPARGIRRSRNPRIARVRG